MALFKVLYRHRCSSFIGWFEVDEVDLIGTETILKAMDKAQLICERLETTQSHQKLYAYVRRRELKFAISDRYF